MGTRITNLKEVEVEILKEIDDFCKQNDITYYLMYGSLIGAVRHKGFIPWDDDIDIALKREDYNKFLKFFNSNRSDTFKVISLESDINYYYPFAKVINTNTVMIEEVDAPMEIGVYVDVFPLDYLPEDKKSIVLMLKKIKRLLNILNIKIIPLKRTRVLYKNIFLFLGKILFKPFTIKYLIKKISNLSQEYNKNTNGTLIGNMSSMVYGNGEIWNASDFKETDLLEFEGSYFNVPIGYKDVLTRTYGDFMKLPPKDKQISHHHNEAYWK